jgi:hypothetical protein
MHQRSHGCFPEKAQKPSNLRKRKPCMMSRALTVNQAYQTAIISLVFSLTELLFHPRRGTRCSAQPASQHAVTNAMRSSHACDVERWQPCVGA